MSNRNEYQHIAKSTRTGWVVAFAVCVLLSACGKGQVSSEVYSAQPEFAAVELDSASSTTTSPSTTSTTYYENSLHRAAQAQGAISSAAVTTTTTVTTTTVKATVSKNDVGFDPSQLAPGTLKSDFISSGLIVPTVYYRPIIDDDKACEDSKRVNLRGEGGTVLDRVCPSTKSACIMQGSCTLVKNGETKAYNFSDIVGGLSEFFADDVDKCPFGFGVNLICLDPFYTVAADPNFHKAGDVIFIPALVGIDVVNGKKHSGFLIVRDIGGGIVGKDRFDFYSGSFDWRNSKNPFAKIKLTDKDTRLQYYKVVGQSAKLVLQKRGYPSLPFLKK